MPWRRLIITVAIIAPLLALFAYGFMRDSRYIHSPLIAAPAAPFSVTLFDQKTLSLQSLRGRAVFLNFWASWCPPCRAEANDLEAAWRKVKGHDVVYIGIALQDTDENARAFLKEFDITYPNGRDDGGKIAVDYGVWGIPESFFIDPQGRITYKHTGGIRAGLVETKLAEALKGIVTAQEGKGDYQQVR
jgi:cytochrome c biogenesis protein CcmG/thiol:disulfide interchange protein DsbE